MRAFADEERAAAAAAVSQYERHLRGLEPRFRRLGLDADDVLQELRFGFALGVRLHDPKRGALRPYCSRRARAQTMRAIYDTGTLIGLPVWLRDKMRQAYRGGAPLDAKITRARDLLRIARLDAPVGDGADAEPLGWLLPSETPSQEDAHASAELRVQVREAMRALTPREREAVEAWLEADGDVRWTEVAKARGRSVNGLKAAWSSARKKLRRALMRMGEAT